MTSLFSPLTFKRGPAMKNRFMLAPLTNLQSHEDGICSEDEFVWLTKRAEGGFGLTMTCAAHVQAEGKGFPGQLGIFSDDHLPGLTRLAKAIKDNDSIAVVQLYHGGMRSPKDVIGMQPLSASDNAKWGARAMTTAEVEGMIEAFIVAAQRAERAGEGRVEPGLPPRVDERRDEEHHGRSGDDLDHDASQGFAEPLGQKRQPGSAGTPRQPGVDAPAARPRQVIPYARRVDRLVRHGSSSSARRVVATWTASLGTG